MTDSAALTEEKAVEIARRFITPRLRPGRPFTVTARRVDRQSLDEHAAQIRLLGGSDSEVESVLQSDELKREHWVVCFFRNQEPDSASTQHPVVILVYDSGEARLAE